VGLATVEHKIWQLRESFMSATVSVSYYVGLDVHRKTISYCVKTSDGRIVREASIPSNREALSQWAQSLDQPWCGGLEATICSHWIYQHLKPFALQLKMGAPVRLKAITAGKRKNDCLDARMLADLLRCNLFPECYVMPPEYADLRRRLRYRALLVHTQVQFKNKTAGLLIENGIAYDTNRLHQKKYFTELLKTSLQIPEELKRLLGFNRMQIETLQRIDRGIVSSLQCDPVLADRIARLRTIDGVGEITALTWALETGEPSRFPNTKHALSYCGLCSPQRESAGIGKRGPLSKQRNRFLQTTLVEAAHLAPRYNEALLAIYEVARQKGSANRATLEVARRLVRYLLAVDRQHFQQCAAA
jgi:transposase